MNALGYGSVLTLLHACWSDEQVLRSRNARHVLASCALPLQQLVSSLGATAASSSSAGVCVSQVMHLTRGGKSDKQRVTTEGAAEGSLQQQESGRQQAAQGAEGAEGEQGEGGCVAGPQAQPLPEIGMSRGEDTPGGAGGDEDRIRGLREIAAAEALAHVAVATASEEAAVASPFARLSRVLDHELPGLSGWGGRKAKISSEPSMVLETVATAASALQDLQEGVLDPDMQVGESVGSLLNSEPVF